MNVNTLLALRMLALAILDSKKKKKEEKKKV